MYFLLALCVLSASVSFADTVEPIPGSITYHGQPTQRLKKAPVGSWFNHEFTDGVDRYQETYRIEPDRSLKLIRRTQINRH